MASEAPLRVLQLGLGARGRTWARIVAGCTLAAPVGYVDPRPEAREWAAAEGPPAAPVFGDLEDALRHVAADIALVVTPPHDRRAMVAALFSQGLHVLAEKPLALSLEDAVSMVREAARAGLNLGVVQNFRYMPASRRLREIVGSGRYGRPTYATILYTRNRDGLAPHLNKYPLVMDHPMLLEQSIHHLDLLRYVYGGEVEDIICQTWNPLGSMYRGDACAAALIRLQNGLSVAYHGTWVSGSNTLAFQWRTDLERGVVMQRDLFGDLVEGGSGDPELKAVPLPHAEPFRDDSRLLLEDFVRACRDGAKFGPSGHDHLRTLALTLACVESAETGRRVALRDFAARHRLESTA
ncbi:MAG: Gfo/Idh/MocA family protein [bacterium]